jgi:uncharacterized protein (DUF927 family)
MNDKDLLSIVQPPDGWFAVLGIKGEDDVRQKLVATREEVDQVAAEYVAQERNVYFGVAKFATDQNRKKPNVKGLKSFWLDIDCGESKTAINEKTGRPEGYIDQATGLQELQTFCKKIGLPKPLLVNSGRGIHAYWPLTREVTREEWEPVAERLRELCVLHNFHIDGKVFEVARVLRIPGTFNFKDNPPTLVEIISDARPVEYDDFRKILGVKEPQPEAPKRELTELAKAMMQNTTSSFRKIMLRGENGCRQLLSAFEDRETLSEPRWFDALSIAKFCSDRDVAIHKMSQGHPDYDYATTEAKVVHIVGPHSCAEFERSNPGGCDGCPHQGKIKSPIVLGKEIAEATDADNTVVVENEEEEDTEVHTIPKYPSPFFRGKNGGIYKMVGEEEEPLRVYEHDLYVIKRMRDPLLGEVIVMKLHLPRDGVKEFVVSNVQVTDKNELRKALSSHGVVCSAKPFNLLMEYLFLSIKELQYKRRAEHMRQQFGWADRDSKFIIGDREITPDGIFHSPPSSTTQNLAQHMQPTGALDKWKEVFALYGRPGLEPHAFATLTAFGSPLLKFLGQNGAIINVIHPNSGTGKTTILHMCNSVYGDPGRLCAMWDDTLAAKLLRLGVMNNLPFTVDEMTNTTPADFSTLAYSMSQGRGRDRVKASSNELRLNLTSWQSISLCSSNASFYEKMASLKSSPDGEMMRLIEYKIDYSPVIDVAEAKHMFDHQLKQNFGHAGDLYAKWLVENLEEAKNTVLGIQAKIDKELRLTQRERFWSAVVAANITGGLIAKNIGLIDWDMKAIYKWATQMILGLRVEVKPPASDVMAVVGDYINRHMQNILVVNEEVDRRTNMAMLPTLEPRGELLIRYEPDTKKMFVAAKPFKNDCVKFQVNYKDTLAQLEKKGIFLGTMNKRLSKGMKVVSPGVHSLIFDCSNTEFISMDEFATPGANDAGGEG